MYEIANSTASESRHPSAEGPAKVAHGVAGGGSDLNWKDLE